MRSGLALVAHQHLVGARRGIFLDLLSQETGNSQKRSDSPAKPTLNTTVPHKA